MLIILIVLINIDKQNVRTDNMQDFLYLYYIFGIILK